MCGRRITSRMKKILSAGFILLMSQSVQAENLMQVYQKALSNDPQIRGAGFTRAAADESVKEAYGRMLPQVGFEIRWNSNLGMLYTLERSTNLIEGFLPLATGVPGAPPTNTYFDASSAALQFYRVKLQ